MVSTTTASLGSRLDPSIWVCSEKDGQSSPPACKSPVKKPPNILAPCLVTLKEGAQSWASIWWQWKQIKQWSFLVLIPINSYSPSWLKQHICDSLMHLILCAHSCSTSTIAPAFQRIPVHFGLVSQLNWSYNSLTETTQGICVTLM